MARPDKSYLEKQTSRRPEKKKVSALGEGSTDSRMAKISFKSYLRQIEEEELLDEEDLYEDDKVLPTDETAIDELYDAFTSENDDLCKEAREKPSVEDGVEFLMDEMKTWLENKGYNGGDIEEWMESDSGDHLWEMFYNGMT